MFDIFTGKQNPSGMSKKTLTAGNTFRGYSDK
jgi:hypothetical protein